MSLDYKDEAMYCHCCQRWWRKSCQVQKFPHKLSIIRASSQRTNCLEYCNFPHPVVKKILKKGREQMLERRGWFSNTWKKIKNLISGNGSSGGNTATVREIDLCDQLVVFSPSQPKCRDKIYIVINTRVSFPNAPFALDDNDANFLCGQKWVAWLYTWKRQKGMKPVFIYITLVAKWEETLTFVC